MKSEVKKKRLSALGWTCIYLVLVIVFLCSGGLIFHSTYYRSIFVSGTSMSPTLLGDPAKANFGIIDTTDWAKKRIKRFDIVTTYFPWSYEGSSYYHDDEDYSQESVQTGDFSVADGENPQYKIKRVIAFGGESIFYFTHINECGDFPEELVNDIIIMKSRDDDHNGIDDGTGDIVAIYRDKYNPDEHENPQDKIDYENNNHVTIRDKTYEIQDLPFYRKKLSYNPTTTYARHSLNYPLNYPIAIPTGRYFVMGDNWCGSYDCGSTRIPIYYDNIVGVLVAIEGTCTIVGETGHKKCGDRHYIWPTVY